MMKELVTLKLGYKLKIPVHIESPNTTTANSLISQLLRYY